MADSNGRQGNGRPVSTIALRFSAALDDAFLLKPELDNLSQSVAQKQQSLSSQRSELEDIEARLRETEARLQDRRQASSRSSSTPPAALSAGPTADVHRRSSAKDPRQRSKLEGVFDPPEGNNNTIPGAGDERNLQYHGIRPSSNSTPHTSAEDHAYNEAESISPPRSPSTGHFETQAIRPKSSQARQENIPPPPRLGSKNGDLKAKSSAGKENWTENGNSNGATTSMDNSWVRV